MSRTANPLQGDKGPQGPTAEQLIGLVDSETSRMLAAQAREGWTTWALLLGLAALGWTLFGVLQFSSVNWRAALETFLVASLALDGSLTLLSLLFFRDPQSLSASNRFQFASRFYGNRLVILFAFFRAIALLVIGLDLRHQASLGGAWAVCLFYGFWALFFAFVLIWDFILIPFQFIPNHSRAFAALLLSLGLVSLYAAFSYGLPLISGQGSAGIPECRLATIALAFLYLVRKLAAKAALHK